ncbi:radical SAM family heme chaperone HemW [Butyrivibrio sp. XPD2002]|uniref:radical SAM family heme chaperone HemW n=1 Tax=Butyrivibrio sp. XPD2002 TaxID=1280665 RepID=UPI00040F589C|nr:radical SAM family heme chaperone HemW [Butyrivibrio sp. XPD2002]
MKSLGIYIHIPFCKQKCLYCDFLSFPEGREQQALYFDALKKEIELSAGECKDYEVTSVFIGGGTPTYPEPAYIADIMEIVKRDYNLSKDAEITIECNPGTADYKALRLYRDAGINRISIGLQSARNEELMALGRIHNRKQFEECYADARQAGFDNINVDLMSALPGQTLRDWENNLEYVCGLEPEPEHISAYSLIIEEETPFYEMYGQNSSAVQGASEKNNGKRYLPLPDEDTEREMYHRTKEILEKYGYSRYEISNYAKDGYECRHNVRYWDCGDYIGFGLGAASLMKGVRYRNTPELPHYIEAYDAARTEVQELTKEEQMEEFMFLGLRMVRGVSGDEFKKRFSCEMADMFGDVIAELRGEELLEVTEEGIHLTDYGMDLSNYCMAKFLL